MAVTGRRKKKKTDPKTTKKKPTGTKRTKRKNNGWIDMIEEKSGKIKGPSPRGTKPNRKPLIPVW